MKIGWWERWGSIGWFSRVPRHIIANILIQFTIKSREEEVEHWVYNKISGIIIF